MIYHYAHCLACEWRSEDEDADKQAEKHTNTHSHPTVSGMMKKPNDA